MEDIRNEFNRDKLLFLLRKILKIDKIKNGAKKLNIIF